MRESPRWRWAVCTLGVVAWSLAAPASAQMPAPAFEDLHRQAQVAHAARDYEALVTSMQAALQQRPRHGRSLYNLAAGLALAGRRDAALEALEQLVAMQLSYPAVQDDDFVSLRGSPRFEAVVAAFAAQLQPIGTATRSFTLGAGLVMPEGIAHDPASGAYFVGGVHSRSVVRYRAKQGERKFAGAAQGLWSVQGMSVGGGRLWLTTTALPEMRDAAVPASASRSALVGLDLRDGRVRQRFDFPAAEKAEVVLGDVIVGPDAALYCSDSVGGGVYRLQPDRGVFEPLIAPGLLRSPQGLAFSADGKTLYVADYSLGIWRVPRTGGAAQRLTAAPGVSAYGIDGLYAYKGDLLAIQNGVRPQRVVRLGVSDDGATLASQRVLVANHPDFDEPTLGVVVGAQLHFVANSHWNRVDEQHRLPAADTLSLPVVLSVELD